MSRCVKCCKMLKTHKKEYSMLEKLLFSFFSLSDSEVLLIFSTEHQNAVETRLTSCLPAGRARDFLQNFPACGRTCAVCISFSM